MDYYNNTKPSYSKIREQILQRDEFICRRCKQSKERKNLVVHHIKRRVDQGNDNLINLITLCVNCHIAIHKTIPFTKIHNNQKEILEKIFIDLGSKL